jgi:transcriptional regulator GlxA family with amidase domain
MDDVALRTPCRSGIAEWTPHLAREPIHVVIWLPSTFYSAVASTIAEILELVNDIRRSQAFTFEFVSRHSPSISTTGISFNARGRPSRKMDVLILLAMPGLDVPKLLQALDEESRYSKPIIEQARQQGAVIAAHCGGCYLLADTGLLDGKRSTISWWLKAEVGRRFPRVRWDASRLLIRHGRIYTCGGGFSGLELAKALLVGLGFAKEERIVRKLLVLPPSREFQSPYEFSFQMPSQELVPSQELEPSQELDSFRRRIDGLWKANIKELNLSFLANQLNLSPRTLSRKFINELQTSPGKWIQKRRLEAAKELLETSKLNISQICYRVGYEDVASFSRLFSKVTGMAPGEFRKHVRF